MMALFMFPIQSTVSSLHSPVVIILLFILNFQNILQLLFLLYTYIYDTEPFSYHSNNELWPNSVLIAENCGGKGPEKQNMTKYILVDYCI